MLRLGIGLSALAFSALLAGASPTAVSAAELAAAGATGTLKVKVTVTGSGRIGSEDPRGEYYEWSVNNGGDLTFELTAMEPSLDADQFAGLGGGDDEDWAQVWDDRFDACSGDEACEMQVTREKMQDPRGRANIAAAMAMMQKMQSGEIDMSPSKQTWTIQAGVVRGTVSVRDHQDTYNIMDAGGGPPVDTHCTTSGQAMLDRKPSGYGDLAPILNVDTKQSTYELHLPVDEYIDVENSCQPGQKRSQALLHWPAKDAKSWPEGLVVTGALDAGAAAKFSGKATWKGDRNGNNIEPMTVAVSWSFVQNP